MGDYYRLSPSGDPIPCDYSEVNFSDPGRKLAFTSRDGVRVSTVFLCFDHSFGGAVPVLWETMVFGGDYEGYQERYTSRDDAIRGRARICHLVFGANNDGPA